MAELPKTDLRWVRPFLIGEEIIMAQGACFDVKDYCETVFADLAVMKSKLHSYVRELEQISESEKKSYRVARNAFAGHYQNYRLEA